MAKNVIKGITIEIGGDATKLDKALTGVNKQSRSLQVELREVNKLLKLDPKNTDLLAQKQEILKEAIEATSEKLDVLKEAEAQVQKQFERGEVSEEQYRALQREVIKCSAELDDLREASKQTDKAMEGLKNSSKLTGEELDKAKERAADFKDNLADLGEKAKTAAVAAGAGLTAAATYATKFETDCDKALNTLVTQTGAANEEVAGLEEAMLSVYKDNFGDDINDVAQAMATVRQQTGAANEELKKTTEAALLMRDTFDIEVNEGVRGVTTMMKQFGISAEEAYNLMAQGVQKGLNQNEDLADQMAEYAVYYADMGFSAQEMFNMIANGAKNGTFQIDYLNDAVKEFGIRVKDGTADDTFKELGLDVEDLKAKFAEGGEGAREAFDTVNNALFSCEDEVQRNILGVTLYGTKWEDLGEDAIRSLTNTQGEISNTTDALSEINAVKYDDLGSQIEDLGRNINTDLIKPIGEELKPIVSDVLEEAKERIPQVREVLLNVISRVKDFASFLSANGPTIISIIAGIAAGFVAWNVVNMIQGVISVITTLGGVLPAISTGIRAINAAMAANPIGLIITIITTLIAALITLFTTNEDFRSKVIAVWEQVKETALNVFGAIADFFTVTLPAAFNSVVNFVKSNWQGLLLFLINPFVGAFKLLYDNCEGFRETINALVENIKVFFAGLWDKIVEIFSGVGQWFSARFTEAYTAVTTIFSGIGQWFSARWTDIKTALSTVATWFLTMFQNAYTNVKNVFSSIGQWFSARWTDIKNVFSTVGSWFQTKFNEAYTNIKNVFSNIGSFFSGIWDKIKGIFTNVGTNIGNAIGGAFKSAINSAIATVENAVNGAIGLINGAIDVINHIPGVSIGHVGSVSLPRLAKGGILKNGQAIMAEAGPELIQMVNGEAIVTPLTRSARNTALDAATGQQARTFVQNVNITSPKELSPYETARQTRNATRRMVLQIQGGA